MAAQRRVSMRRQAAGAWLSLLLPALSLHAAAPGAHVDPPRTDPDHIVLVASDRVAAVYSDTIDSDGAGRQAWFRIDYPVPPKAPPGSRRHWRQVLGSFDCQTRRWRPLAQRQSEPPPSPGQGAGTGAWQAVADAPVAAAVLDYVCRYSGPSLPRGETIYLM